MAQGEVRDLRRAGESTVVLLVLVRMTCALFVPYYCPPTNPWDGFWNGKDPIRFEHLVLRSGSFAGWGEGEFMTRVLEFRISLKLWSSLLRSSKRRLMRAELDA